MSFQNYVSHIKRKYIVAVAIAIIKSKPTDQSIDEYLFTLQNRLTSNEEMDIDTNLEEISLCSEDFDFTDCYSTQPGICTEIQTVRETASPNILQDFDLENFIQANLAQKNSTEDEPHLPDIDAKQVSSTIQHNAATESQSTFCDELALLSQRDNREKVDDSQSTYCENVSQIDHDTFVDIDEAADDTQKQTHTYIDVDSQETEIYTVRGYTQDCTHISQSQTEDHCFDILEKFVVGTNKNRANESTQLDNKTAVVTIKPSTSKRKEDDRTEGAAEYYTNISKDSLTLVNQTSICTQTTDAVTPEIETELINCQQLPHIAIMDDDVFESPKNSVLPFKIIEEFNRIKSYLNRRIDRRNSNDSFSSDSGYRSDSQGKSCRSALQFSGKWLNQSAHSLFTFLMCCPLNANCMEIITEISQVLGDLVDRLHTEEKYPPFLDDVLESIKILLENIMKEDCSDIPVTNKEDSIQRLLLFNTSHQLTEYTIEKITKILENIHKNLTNDTNLYELVNVSSTENCSYIFHTLEILLKRYYTQKKYFSQNSQSESEKLLPKKSEIADIWKRKWDPNYKDKEITTSVEVKCVSSNVSEILNKIVVDCMDGYSLISFAALQCFNNLQT